MKANWFKQVAVFVVSALLLILPASAQSTSFASTPATTQLTMTVPESITLTVTPNLTFTYSASGGGTGTASGPETITVTADLAAGHSAIATYAYFTSANALTGGSVNIPSSAVFDAFGASPANACNGTQTGLMPVAAQTTGLLPVGANFCKSDSSGGSGGFVTETLTPAAGAYSANNTMTLSMAGLGVLAPNTYTGTLNFITIAF